MRRLARVCATCALLFQLGIAACHQTSSAGLPADRNPEELKRRLAQTDGTIKVPGLKDQVRVVRDHSGIPHIYAKNAGDLFFAQGFVQAQSTQRS